MLRRANDSQTGIPFSGETPTPERNISWQEREVAIPFRAEQGAWGVEAQVSRTDFDSAFRDRQDTSGFGSSTFCSTSGSVTSACCGGVGCITSSVGFSSTLGGSFGASSACCMVGPTATSSVWTSGELPSTGGGERSDRQEADSRNRGRQAGVLMDFDPERSVSR